MWQGNYTVLVNGEPYPFVNFTDTKDTYLYFKYHHSERKVVIIPEFPSNLISLLLALVIVIAIVLRKYK